MFDRRKNIALIIIFLSVIFFCLFFLYLYKYKKNNSTTYYGASPKDIVSYKQIGKGCGNVYINDKLVKLKPKKIPIKVLYEDNNMAVVAKPAGLLSIPSSTDIENSLVNALLFMYGDNLSDADGELCRGIVHRLDKDTSGILMIAKNNKTRDYLKKKIKEHQITKKYLAIVKGVIKEDRIIIDKKIKEDPNKKFKMKIDKNNGKASKTIVKVLKRYKDATFVEVQIITGRTHQIRVHMASVGHPVLNDELYGTSENFKDIKGQILMSYKLIFPHPFDGKEIKIQIPPEKRIEKVLEILDKNN